MGERFRAFSFGLRAFFQLQGGCVDLDIYPNHGESNGKNMENEMETAIYIYMGIYKALESWLQQTIEHCSRNVVRSVPAQECKAQWRKIMEGSGALRLWILCTWRVRRT